MLEHWSTRARWAYQTLFFVVNWRSNPSSGPSPIQILFPSCSMCFTTCYQTLLPRLLPTNTTRTPRKSARTQNPRRRSTTSNPDERTTVRVPTAQNSTKTNPPQILAPTQQTRRQTLRPSPSLPRKPTSRPTRNRSHTTPAPIAALRTRHRTAVF